MENFRLRVFRVVATYLNFRRAAEELSLTQPAVTQQVHALEEELGVALFDRSGGRVRLTGAGEALLPYAERIASLSQEAVEVVTAMTGTSAGELLVGASQTNAQYILPRVLLALQREHPNLQLRTLTNNTEDVLKALIDRRVSIAMIEGPTLRRDVKTVPFMEDELVLVAPPRHPWAGKEIGAEELRQAPLLLREIGSGSRRVVEAALSQAGVPMKNLQVKMTFDSTEGLLSGVEGGLGIAFVSQWAVRNQLALGTLAVVRLAGVKILRVLSIAYPGGPAPGGLAGKFVRFMATRAGEVLLESLRTPPAAAAANPRKKRV
jgi:DNA-binding transcriptional LysR family regulator